MKVSRTLLLSTLAVLSTALTVRAADGYKLGPDSSRQPGVQQGGVTKFSWRDSKVYPNTWRDWWIYVPQQYDPAKPACVMIFCDGEVMIREKIGYRVPTVFDNLIAKNEMPLTIGVFINPGDDPHAPDGHQHSANRSVEYDSLADTYARFLVEEIMPQVRNKYQLTKDPAGWAICGNSSGGICAFTAAWERPETFGKVVSHIGSFTNIRGGDVYPALIRKTKEDAAPDSSPQDKAKLAQRRKIRVFLQDGSNDLDNAAVNWPLANQEMASALKFAGWDYKFVFGTGADDHMHAAAIFPDTMRWLWRDHSTVDGVDWRYVHSISAGGPADNPFTQHYGGEIRFMPDAGLHLAFVNAYDSENQQVYLDLKYSRDGINFYGFSDPNPFVKTANPFDWYFGELYPEPEIVQAGDRYYQLVSGASLPHYYAEPLFRHNAQSEITADDFKSLFGKRRMAESLPYFKSLGGWEGLAKHAREGHHAVGTMSYRADGWFGVRADSREGVFITRPIAGGGKLSVNACVAEDGLLRVELLDANDRVLDTATVKGDSIHTPVFAMPAGDFRLRVTMRRSDLYTMYINP